MAGSDNVNHYCTKWMRSIVNKEKGPACVAFGVVQGDA